MRRAHDNNGISDAKFFQQEHVLEESIAHLQTVGKVGDILSSFISKFSSGDTYNAQTGMNTTASATVEAAGAIGGTLVGSEVGAAIGTAIGGPVGTVVGGIIGDLVGSKIEALTTLIGDRLDYLANHSKKSRDEILKAGLTRLVKMSRTWQRTLSKFTNVD